MLMQDERCELCEGELEQRQVLARFRHKRETINIDHIPAWVCKQCGEQYYDAPVYKHMERTAQFMTEGRRTGQLAIAANALLVDYLEDEALTSFTALDSEPFQ